MSDEFHAEKILEVYDGTSGVRRRKSAVNRRNIEEISKKYRQEKIFYDVEKIFSACGET